jgi:hypothetical protein
MRASRRKRFQYPCAGPALAEVVMTGAGAQSASVITDRRSPIADH